MLINIMMIRYVLARFMILQYLTTKRTNWHYLCIVWNTIELTIFQMDVGTIWSRQVLEKLFSTISNIKEIFQNWCKFLKRPARNLWCQKKNVCSVKPSNFSYLLQKLWSNMKKIIFVSCYDCCHRLFFCELIVSPDSWHIILFFDCRLYCCYKSECLLGVVKMTLKYKIVWTNRVAPN